MGRDGMGWDVMDGWMDGWMDGCTPVSILCEVCRVDHGCVSRFVCFYSSCYICLYTYLHILRYYIPSRINMIAPTRTEEPCKTNKQANKPPCAQRHKRTSHTHIQVYILDRGLWFWKKDSPTFL